MEEKTAKKRAVKKIAVDAEKSPFDSFASSPVKTPAKTPKKTSTKKAKTTVGGTTPAKKTAVKKPGKNTAKTVVNNKIDTPFEAKAPGTATAVLPRGKKTAVKTTDVSPVFKTLSEPVLPPLKRENRARLMMQTPTELYFYWSVRENPYHLLRKAFGNDTGSYTLALKLTNLNTGEEDIHPAEPEGNWWFHVEPNGKYEAEIGFYAPNRPYFRIIYSNTVETPRRAPSPRPATESVWTVSANKFAEVLDVAGFTSDAVDVAMAGDDHFASETATQTAFSHFAGINETGLHGIAGEDIRYALRALASGIALEELRYTVGPKLFGILQTRSADLSAEKAVSAIGGYFDVAESEYIEEEAGSAVFGASLVSFPRTVKPRDKFKRYAPVSSHSYPS
jgi:hypothetical protein